MAQREQNQSTVYTEQGEQSGYQQAGGPVHTSLDPDNEINRRARNEADPEYQGDDLDPRLYPQDNEINRRARNEGNMPGNEAEDPDEKRNPDSTGNMPGNEEPPTSEEGPWNNDPPEYGEFQPDRPHRPGEGEQNPLRMGDGQNPKNPTPQGTVNESE
ncbi:MAG: hypothetical protein KF824_01165 [Fimbriimonadaceae bacterium]|nr:MAG: hypothetical protein KF824_01165 [Fimbriimonadaceae bacterium]